MDIKEVEERLTREIDGKLSRAGRRRKSDNSFAVVLFTALIGVAGASLLFWSDTQGSIRAIQEKFEWIEKWITVQADGISENKGRIERLENKIMRKN